MSLKMEAVGATDIVLMRKFPASPEDVFAAHTQPDLIEKWMTGPDGWAMTSCKCDAEPGGTFRYEYAHGGGRPGFSISGMFATVDAPKRLTYREVMAMAEGQTETQVDLQIRPGKTSGAVMRVSLSYASTDLRDAIMDAGMKDGMEASYAKLDAVLE